MINGLNFFQRTYISEDNKTVLEELYAGGMRYKGQQCAQKIEEAVQSTGLPTQTIKVIIVILFNLWMSPIQFLLILSEF